MVLTKRDVREGLGEVAHETLCDRVVLLGEKAEVVAQREQPLEELHRFVVAADEMQVVGQPERTGEEGALATRQSVDVVRLLRVVPAHKTVHREITPDGLHRPHDPGSFGGRNPTRGIMSTLASSSLIRSTA